MGKRGGENVPEEEEGRKEGVVKGEEEEEEGLLSDRRVCPQSPSRLGIGNREPAEVLSLPLSSALLFPERSEPLTIISPLSTRTAGCIHQTSFGEIERELEINK